MRVLGDTVRPKLTVLCCTHGDEVFGADVFEYFADRIDTLDRLLLILCNEEAYKAGTRQVDSNLNRIYPGRVDGDTEHRLAHQITQLMWDTEFMIDIHTTTTSDDSMTYVPIISKWNPGVKEILAHTDAANIFRMPELTGSGTSTIDQVRSGVGLEFHKDFAQTPAALKVVKKVVLGVLNEKPTKPKSRRIFQFAGKYPVDTVFAPDQHTLEPFDFQGSVTYPFIFGSENYASDEGFYGFYAERFNRLTF